MIIPFLTSQTPKVLLQHLTFLVTINLIFSHADWLSQPVELACCKFYPEFERTKINIVFKVLWTTNYSLGPMIDELRYDSLLRVFKHEQPECQTFEV